MENVVAPRRVYDPKRVKLQATIAAYGAPASKRTVTLVLNGRVLQTKMVDVPENGRGQAEFLGLDAPYGFSRGEVRIERRRTRLAGDDRYLFSVERADPRKVLFVDDGRHPRAELYFRDALDSAGDGAFTVEEQRPESAAVATLSMYPFIVLSDLGNVPPQLDSALQNYVRNGGSVLVALGPAATAVLSRGPVLDESHSGVQLRGPRRRPLPLGDRHGCGSHSRAAQRGSFHRREVLSNHIRVNPTKSCVLAKMNDQTPLLMERNIGEGKVMAFATTFDNVSNDLPLHASWVPFVTQTALYLGGGGAEQPVNLPAWTPTWSCARWIQTISPARALRPRCWMPTASGCCRWTNP